MKQKTLLNKKRYVRKKELYKGSLFFPLNIGDTVWVRDLNLPATVYTKIDRVNFSLLLDNGMYLNRSINSLNKLY